MAARTPHPILSAAPSFDALSPIGDDVDHHEARIRDRAARAPFDAAAERFVLTPGPAERVREVADNKLSTGERAFGAAMGGLTLTMAGVLAASLLRHFGIC